MVHGFGKTIQKLIHDNNLSVLAAEKKCGLKRGTMWNIVTGRTAQPREATLEAIAHGLGCSMADLYAELLTEKSSATAQSPALPWNSRLYMDVVEAVSEAFEKRTSSPSKTQVLEVAEDVYAFSLRKGHVDNDLIEILLNKIRR